MPQKLVIKIENGFTLIEVLIGVVILSIALLAIASLAGTSIKGNAHSREVTTATMLNLSQFENLRNIAATNFDHANLQQNVNNGNYVNYFDANGIIGNIGDPYTVTWSVTDDAAPANVKTIIFTTSWLEGGETKNLSYTTILSR